MCLAPTTDGARKLLLRAIKSSHSHPHVFSYTPQWVQRTSLECLLKSGEMPDRGRVRQAGTDTGHKCLRHSWMAAALNPPKVLAFTQQTTVDQRRATARQDWPRLGSVACTAH